MMMVVWVLVCVIAYEMVYKIVYVMLCVIFVTLTFQIRSHHRPSTHKVKLQISPAKTFLLLFDFWVSLSNFILTLALDCQSITIMYKTKSQTSWVSWEKATIEIKIHV